MKLTLGIFVLIFTASFSYSEYTGSQGIKPNNFEIKKIQDHHWNTDYDAFRSYGGEIDLNAYPRSRVPILDLNIDVEFIKEKLEVISGEKSFLLNGKETVIPQRGNRQSKDIALEFLKLEYEKLGYKTSIVGNNTDIKNFQAVREGEITNKFVVLTSHMDSVWNAGADDNGSGTIANLAIAKALQEHGLKYSLKIIAFDVEELGLVGSKHYVKNTDRTQILLNWNLDMVGFDSDKDRAIHVMDCDRADSLPIKTRAIEVINALKLPLKITKACTDRSDHASFWAYNVPAVIASENFFGKDGNSCYHSACDKTNLVDYEYMTLITRLTGSSVLTFLQGY